MGIGLMDFGHFSSSYGMQNIPRVTPAQVKEQEQQQKEAASVVQTPVVETPAAPKASRIANLEDVSLTFNKEESFGYIGSEKELSALDEARPVSDTQKDSILQGYQYFVGPTSETMQSQLQDGLVFLKQ